MSLADNPPLNRSSSVDPRIPGTADRRGHWGHVVIPFVVYTLAALFMTWPLATQLTTHIAGAGYSDSMEYVRLGWWGKYALQHGINPFYQSLLGYPEGFFSATQAAQPLIYWPITLLSFVFSPTTAFNIWLLLEIILSGMAAYWLCLDVVAGAPLQLGERRIAALIGGLIFMAFPTVQGHLVAGHVNPLSNYALPVVALSLYRIVDRRGGIQNTLIGGIALWILALGNFTFPVYILLPLILFGGGCLLLFRRATLLRRAALRDVAILLGLALLLTLPFYVPLLQEITSPNRPTYLQEGGWVQFSTDPLSFVALSPFASWTKAIAPAYSGIVLGTNSTEGTAYLGVVAVLLAIIALTSRQKSAGLWLAIALGCMIFSLGPLLKWYDQPVTYTIGDIQSHVPLPWALFQSLPGVIVTRTPGRFNFVTGLALGVLAALGLNVALRRLTRAVQTLSGFRVYIPVAAGAILAIFILFEYQLFAPFLTVPAALPGYFSELATRDDVRAVLDVPMNDPLAQKQAMYQQIAHQKPLIAGYVSRGTAVDPARLAILSDAALGKLTWNALTNDASSVEQVDLTRAVLKDNGVDVVIYHWAVLDKEAILKWAGMAFGTPAYNDDQIGIFEIPRPTAAHGDRLAIAYPGAGWWHAPTGDWWLNGDATLYVYAPVDMDRRWLGDVIPLLQTRRLQLAVDGTLVSAWQIDPPGEQTDFSLRLSRGFHTLQFRLPDGCTPVPVAPRCLLYTPGEMASWASNDPEKNCALRNSDKNLCVAFGLLNGMSAQDAGSPVSGMGFQAHEVNLSNGLSLRGFRYMAQASAGKTLDIQTDWYATQKLPGDYHLFVHLLDAQGTFIAQADTVPGDGTFPTAVWSVPQTWIEMLHIKLPATLTPGKYSLYAGWYSYPGLVRLKVEGNAPHAQDGLTYLGDVQIG